MPQKNGWSNLAFRKVTMDEIASDLHMSKNTIYKLFVGKEEIAKSLGQTPAAAIEYRPG